MNKVCGWVVVNRNGQHETRVFGPKHGAERQFNRLSKDQDAVDARGPFVVVEFELTDE